MQATLDTIEEIKAKLNTARMMRDWRRVEIYENRVKRWERAAAQVNQLSLFEQVASPQERAQIAERRVALSLKSAMLSGFWFCNDCPGVIVAEIDPDKRECPKCKSRRIAFSHGVPA